MIFIEIDVNNAGLQINFSISTDRSTCLLTKHDHFVCSGTIWIGRAELFPAFFDVCTAWVDWNMFTFFAIPFASIRILLEQLLNEDQLQHYVSFPWCKTFCVYQWTKNRLWYNEVCLEGFWQKISLSVLQI